MKIIADSMASLPRFYVNELLTSLFPVFVDSLHQNHEFFTLASMLLKQTQTQAAFASLCLEHVLANLTALDTEREEPSIWLELDTEREEPSIWLELARLCTSAKLTNDMSSVYCCYLPVAESPTSES